MYKRRRGWWEEYGLYIKKSRSGDYMVGIYGHEGGPLKRYPTFEDAEHAVEEYVTIFWDGHAGESFFDGLYEGGLD